MTTGSIILPNYSKEWSGTDGRHRDNPYWMRSSSSLDGAWRHTGTGWSVSTVNGTGAGVLGFNQIQAIDDGVILDRLGNRLHSHKFQAGMFLAEGRESISMIHSAATRVQDAVVAFEHKSAPGILKALGVTPIGKALSATSRALAAGFLAWNFGWKPVLSDMQTGAEALASLVDDSETVSNHRTVVRVVRRASAIMAGGHGGGYREIGVRLQTAHSLSYDQSVKESLSLNDPISLAYDLVPLSFVLNWVYPVGDYLDRLHTASVYTGSSVRTSWERIEVSIESFPANLGGVDGIWVGSYRSRSMEMTRVCSQGTPWNIPTPQLQVPNSLFAASTAVSLLVQRVLGRQ